MRRLLLLATASLLAACGTAPTTGVRAAGEFAAAQATGPTAFAAFYGMDDYTGSDTQPELKKLHAQLAAVGSTPDAPLFLAGDASTKDDGFRTRVAKGQAWGTGFEGLGELKTNQAPALRDFLGWVSKNAGTKQLHLSIATHGGGYGGILLDHDGKPEVPAASMTLQKAAKALAKGHDGGRIASLTFDACMMASIEVGEALKGTVAVMTGSEDFSMGGSTPYDVILGKLAKGELKSGEAFGKAVATHVVKDGKWGDAGSLTWTAIALDQRHEALVKAVDRLARALRKALPAERAAIDAACADTKRFAIMERYFEHYGEYWQRDLVDLCNALGKRVKDEHVQASAKAVTAAVKGCVVGFAKHPSESMANGIAIYLPHGKKGRGMLGEYRQSLFARHTEWDEFLAELNP